MVDPYNPDLYIRDFNPPIFLSAHFTAEDLEFVSYQMAEQGYPDANPLDYLRLGFWDEENLLWISFSQNSKYNFHVDGDEAGGYAWATIASWGDRHIAFGGDG